MSQSFVDSIPALHSFYNRLSAFVSSSAQSAMRFNHSLLDRIARLEAIGERLEAEVEKAQCALRSCEIARAGDPPDSKRSCGSQEAALARAEKKYNKYLIHIQQIYVASEELKQSYSSFQSRHSSLQSSLPALLSAITALSRYSSGSAVVGGSQSGSISESSTGHILNSESIKGTVNPSDIIGGGRSYRSANDGAGLSGNNSETKTEVNGTEIIPPYIAGGLMPLGVVCAGLLLKNQFETGFTREDPRSIIRKTFDNNVQGGSYFQMFWGNSDRNLQLRQLYSDFSRVTLAEYEKLRQQELTDWEKRMEPYTFDYTSLYGLIGEPQKYLGLVALLTARNAGELPICIGKENGILYFYSHKSYKLFAYGLSSSNLVITDTDHRYADNIERSVTNKGSESPLESLLMFMPKDEKWNSDNYHINDNGSAYMIDFDFKKNTSWSEEVSTVSNLTIGKIDLQKGKITFLKYVEELFDLDYEIKGDFVTHPRFSVIKAGDRWDVLFQNSSSGVEIEGRVKAELSLKIETPSFFEMKVPVLDEMNDVMKHKIGIGTVKVASPEGSSVSLNSNGLQENSINMRFPEVPLYGGAVTVQPGLEAGLEIVDEGTTKIKGGGELDLSVFKLVKLGVNGNVEASFNDFHLDRTGELSAIVSQLPNDVRSEVLNGMISRVEFIEHVSPEVKGIYSFGLAPITPAHVCRTFQPTREQLTGINQILDMQVEKINTLAQNSGPEVKNEIILQNLLKLDISPISNIIP